VTTRTKLNITGGAASVMMMLNVFSKPLHIPEAFQWILIIGVFVPLGLMFYFVRVLKRERAEGVGVEKMGDSLSAELRKKTKERLWLGMGLGCVVSLSSPLWLPITGASSGPTGDFVVGLITTVICCAIIGFRLRKL
jgi:hypothetical protein